ncbi:oxidoreductase [Sinomonas atrocyanea]|uniref:Oxidoreductase n=1 Tax=Sinomonas atrocyanea TaxID=37927 RepID=A0A126ZZG7_9MICC|nr:SDR family NAD(P)-dependent oxidoreductase [Sinomonas atrocyanea]AMM32569.1 oxidoreductase [Sinomonas atrocyanea]GEB62605.1 oxidoreductase [Sinomonas atrocyanea]
MTLPPASGAQGAAVVVAGATSASGRATVRALRAAGATAIAVGSDAGRLAEAFGPPAAADGAVPQHACDLADFAATQRLAEDLRARFGSVDGVIHLVGGWRGGGTFAEQSDADWDFLARGAITTLRNTSRAFFEDIAASPRGRFAMVSSTTLDRPSAANANYQAAKAAAEAWTRSMAQGLALQQSARKEDPLPQASAAVVLAVKALLDDAQRAAAPDRKFPGYTHVDVLAARAVALFSEDAAEINGGRLDLTG